MYYRWTLQKDDEIIHYVMDRSYMELPTKCYGSKPPEPHWYFTSLEEAQESCTEFWLQYLKDRTSPLFRDLSGKWGKSAKKEFPILASINIWTENFGGGFILMDAFHKETADPFDWQYTRSSAEWLKIPYGNRPPNKFIEEAKIGRENVRKR